MGGFGDVLGIYQVHQQRERGCLDNPAPIITTSKQHGEAAQAPSVEPSNLRAAGGLWRAAGEGAPPRLPQAKDEHITFLFRNLGQDPCHPQGRAPAHQRKRHQGSCLLLWAHSHPPRQQAPSLSTPATPPVLLSTIAPRKSHPPVTYTFPLFLNLRQPLSYSLPLHTVSPLLKYLFLILSLRNSYSSFKTQGKSAHSHDAFLGPSSSHCS